jgi:hypothetical protein
MPISMVPFDSRAASTCRSATGQQWLFANTGFTIGGER